MKPADRERVERPPDPGNDTAADLGQARRHRGTSKSITGEATKKVYIGERRERRPEFLRAYWSMPDALRQEAEEHIATLKPSLRTNERAWLGEEFATGAAAKFTESLAFAVECHRGRTARQAEYERRDAELKAQREARHQAERERNRIRWQPFALPAAGAQRIREIFAAQDEHRRKHPGLWIPAPPFALRLRPLRSITPTLEVRMLHGKERAAAWQWPIAADIKPSWIAWLDGVDPEYAAIRARTIGRDDALDAIGARRNALLVATIERFGTDEQPFAGLSHCCICGRGLIDADSIARGIGPECILLFGTRSESCTATIVAKRAGPNDLFDESGQ